MTGPSPAQGAVRFDMTLSSAGAVDVGVFDVTGRRVSTLAIGAYDAGHHPLVWDGASATGAGAGIYFVRARWPGFDETRRVVRLR